MTALELVALQALDDGLWFQAEHITEAYLQDALRQLHAAVEAEGKQKDELAEATK